MWDPSLRCRPPRVASGHRYLARLLVLAGLLLSSCSSQSEPTKQTNQEPIVGTEPSGLQGESPESCQSTPVDCNATYLEFARRHSEHARPVANCKALHAQLLELWKGTGSIAPIEPLEPRPGFDLRSALRHELNINFLLQSSGQLVERAAPAFEVHSQQQLDNGVRELQIRLNDTQLGNIPALLILPPGSGPFPTLLALPGHGQNPRQWLDSISSHEITERNFALMVLGIRAYDSHIKEHQASLTLLCQGFSLIGLRVSEAMSALAFIEQHPSLRGDRIGLLGHSGGSTALNLLVHLSSVPRALVSDLRSDYFNFQEIEGRYYLLDETHIGLHRLSPLINQAATAPVPTLDVEYGAPEGLAPLLDFLAQHLKP